MVFGFWKKKSQKTEDKDTGVLPYKIKLIEKMEYRSLEQKNLDDKIKQFEHYKTSVKEDVQKEKNKLLADVEKEKSKLEYEKRKFAKEKESLIQQARSQLLEQGQKTLAKLKETQMDLLLYPQEKEEIKKQIAHDPYLDLDTVNIPYYNIRKAIRKAHANSN
jgi:hypothetical protein